MDIQKHNNGNNNAMTNGALSPAEQHLAAFLRAAETDYDQDLTPERIHQWMSLLQQGFRLQEITDAFSQVQVDQPGGWTGFPKRPDVIARMMRNREQKAEEFKNKGGWNFRDVDCTICGGIGWEKKQTVQGNLSVVRCICGERKLEAARNGSQR